jgi:hypothetical protein
MNKLIIDFYEGLRRKELEIVAKIEMEKQKPNPDERIIRSLQNELELVRYVGD